MHYTYTYIYIYLSLSLALSLSLLFICVFSLFCCLLFFKPAGLEVKLLGS